MPWSQALGRKAAPGRSTAQSSYCKAGGKAGCGGERQSSSGSGQGQGGALRFLFFFVFGFWFVGILPLHLLRTGLVVASQTVQCRPGGVLRW